MKQKNIILCGFMGSGKTTVGRRMAPLAKMQFIDLDDYIAERQGKTVSAIFAGQGEEAFRRMETEAATALSNRTGLVIAAGGGTLLRAANVRIFRKNGSIVLLDTPLSILQERLKNDTFRPLLQRPDRKQFIADLYRRRMPAYCMAADFIVEGGYPAEKVAAQILDRIRKG